MSFRTYHQIRTYHRFSACDGYICAALPVRSVVVAVLPFSVFISVFISNLLIMHSKSRHIARAKKRTRKVCTAIQKLKKGTKRTLLSRAPSIGECFCVRARLFSSSLCCSATGSFHFSKGVGPLDVTFARSEDDREGIFRCRLPDVGSSSTPNASAGRAVHSSRRAHSLGSSRSRPRKTRIFSFFFFLECALSLSFSSSFCLQSKTCRRRSKKAAARRKKRQQLLQQQQQPRG